ncbi:MAG: PhnA protein [Hyphomicrobiales bacterium]|nr:MAG: PhnA protein [Hyphomicrobiales bacterium]
MAILEELQARSGSKCELCSEVEGLNVYEVPPESDGGADKSALICTTCLDQVEKRAAMHGDHWRCLNESMWTQEPAVQVLAWRMLKRLSAETWAVELFDMLYLEEETLAWAQSVNEEPAEDMVVHVDSNGNVLAAGDTVTLIKDLNVKGTTFTAKRGTAVRKISLVPDNAGHIEGRVNGQQIVILTEFVKKSN